MKTTIACLAFAMIIFTSCKVKKDKSNTEEGEAPQTEMVTGDNSRNALDWADVYRGTLPCADCEGVATEITLNQDLSYTKRVRYVGKSDEIIRSTGTFTWDDLGRNITLKGTDGDTYKVGENILIALDGDGNLLMGDLNDRYVLKKAAMDTGIIEKYWKLIEMNGQTINTDENQKKEIHLILKEKDSPATGFGGCNSFSGSYTLDESTNVLSFSKMRTTLMACDILQTEDMFHEVLGKTDNYTINNDTLTLSKGKMAPLLKFVAMYLN